MKDGYIKYKNGEQEWWKNGKLHREDGPARIYQDGSQEWYLRGKRHRLNGPAVICEDGTEEWWVDDLKLGFGVEGFYALWDRLNGEQREDLTLQKFFPGLPK
jgi:hypothetical protein